MNITPTIKLDALLAVVRQANQGVLAIYNSHKDYDIEREYCEVYK
jgi:predicted glutamine amidotransferase